MSARRGIFVAPFDELAEPGLVAELAARADAAGWDGFFVWDHVAFRPPVSAIADPWVTLAAVAVATQRVEIGALVTPLPRRRMHQLARETVTLDRLSGGRLVFGIGLGSTRTGEFDPERFGEEGDPKVRGDMLDAGLARLRAYWDGEFEPRPVREIPVWAAVRHPPRGRPLRRAATLDGVFPVDLETPDDLARLVDGVAAARGDVDGYEVVVSNAPGTDVEPWIAAGATWCLTGFGPQPAAADVRAAIDAGP